MNVRYRELPSDLPPSVKSSDEPGREQREQAEEGEPQLVPQQPPEHARQRPEPAPALPGKRVTRRPVRHREHQVRVPGVGGQQRGGERVAVGHRPARR